VTQYDPVNRPSHYASSPTGVECIDAIEASMNPEEYKGYLRGCAFKYLWRFRHKGGRQDLAKAQWYLNRLIQALNEPVVPVEVHE
jgi:hypothetical protein